MSLLVRKCCCFNCPAESDCAQCGGTPWASWRLSIDTPLSVDPACIAQTGASQSGKWWTGNPNNGCRLFQGPGACAWSQSFDSNYLVWQQFTAANNCSGTTYTYLKTGFTWTLTKTATPNQWRLQGSLSGVDFFDATATAGGNNCNPTSLTFSNDYTFSEWAHGAAAPRFFYGGAVTVRPCALPDNCSAIGAAANTDDRCDEPMTAEIDLTLADVDMCTDCLVTFNANRHKVTAGVGDVNGTFRLDCTDPKFTGTAYRADGQALGNTVRSHKIGVGAATIKLAYSFVIDGTDCDPIRNEALAETWIVAGVSPSPSAAGQRLEVICFSSVFSVGGGGVVVRHFCWFGASVQISSCRQIDGMTLDNQIADCRECSLFWGLYPMVVDCKRLNADTDTNVPQAYIDVFPAPTINARLRDAAGITVADGNDLSIARHFGIGLGGTATINYVQP